jgi:thiamine biosynthesis lipoprotein
MLLHPVTARRAGPAAEQWPLWGSVMLVLVGAPGALPAARRIAERQAAAVDRACGPGRHTSEIHRLYRAGGRTVTVSPLLADLVAASLEAARRSDGDLDPTVGATLNALRYAKDVAAFPVCGGALGGRARPAPGWRTVHLDGRRLTVPAGVSLHLGATAKAFLADRCAAAVADRLGTGVLVAVGGKLATAGPGPDGGWPVLVGDGAGRQQGVARVLGGCALSTSGGDRQAGEGPSHEHPVVDPRTGGRAPAVWRSVTTAASTCTLAATYSTAALVRGDGAPGWLRSLGVPAQLVSVEGEVVLGAGWPARMAA